jgi:hypothetical protein
MKFLGVADWACSAGIVFGVLCLMYATYCIVDNLIYRANCKSDHKKRLAAHASQTNKILLAHNQKLQDLLEHARSRECELTEERDRLATRAKFLATELKYDDMSRKQTVVWKRTD